MVTVLGHAYPWDVLGDPAFVDRVRDLGLDGVNLAAAYHTTRAATPWHPSKVLVDAAHSAFYRPLREGAWPGPLRPGSPSAWVPEPDSFGAAARILADAGIPVHAWIVVAHNSFLGRRHPELTVRNCFGDRYPYALCVSHEEVREYAATLVAEAVRDLPLAGVCLEACGQLGFDHGGHHEKTDGAYGLWQRRLLSLCCCPGCAGDRDPSELRRAVREPGFRTELAEELLEVRQDATDRLRAAVLERLEGLGGLRVTLHGDPDPWATGALPGLTAKGGREVDSVVVPCWPVSTESATRVARAKELYGPGTSVGAYVTVLPPAGDVRDHVGGLRRAGAAELHLYHLGLAGPERHDWLSGAVRAFKET